MLAAKDGFIEYASILVFDTVNHYLEWNISPERENIMKELQQKKGVFLHNVAIDSDRNDPQVSPMSRISLQDSLALLPRPLPPPKWKLTFIIFCGVYVAVVLTGISFSLQL